MIVGYGLIPLLMRQPVTSAYEILESRLGTSIRLAGAGVFLLLRFGWMATILFATSHVVLVPLLGIDPWWTPWLCVALGVVTAMYSSWGGIKAVVTTDAIQSITMLVGAVVDVGGDHGADGRRGRVVARTSGPVIGRRRAGDSIRSRACRLGSWCSPRPSGTSARTARTRCRSSGSCRPAMRRRPEKHWSSRRSRMCWSPCCWR